MESVVRHDGVAPIECNQVSLSFQECLVAQQSLITRADGLKLPFGEHIQHIVNAGGNRHPWKELIGDAEVGYDLGLEDRPKSLVQTVLTELRRTEVGVDEHDRQVLHRVGGAENELLLGSGCKEERLLLSINHRDATHSGDGHALISFVGDGNVSGKREINGTGAKRERAVVRNNIKPLGLCGNGVCEEINRPAAKA